jgi:hypothetical protein
MLRLPRDEFLTDFWDYRPGEHVSFIEPTQQGKTYLMYQCLDAAMNQNSQLQTVSLMPKPKDPATVYWKDQLGLKEIAVWPPSKWFWETEPRGYVLWPKHIPDNEDANRLNLNRTFARCFNDQYWQGDSITVADDVYLHAVLYGLNSELERHWTAGSGGGAGLWSANQKPSGTLGGGSVSSFSYNAPTHLFLGKDRDERNIKRFGEIGGIDPHEVESVVRNLKMARIGDHAISEKLYIDKRGPYMCIVGWLGELCLLQMHFSIPLPLTGLRTFITCTLWQTRPISATGLR